MPEIRITSTSLYDIAAAIKAKAWETIWKEEGIEYKDHQLIMVVRYCGSEQIGYFTVGIIDGDFYTNETEVKRQAVFGNVQDIIRQAIKTWDEVNNEKYIIDFLAKQNQPETS